MLLALLLAAASSAETFIPPAADAFVLAERDHGRDRRRGDDRWDRRNDHRRRDHRPDARPPRVIVVPVPVPIQPQPPRERDYIYEETPQAEPAPAIPAPEVSFVSPDGTRRVRIAGTNRDAFLYGGPADPAFPPRALASHVTEVRFERNIDGALEIFLVIEKVVNGQVVRYHGHFDASGTSLIPAAPTGLQMHSQALPGGLPVYRQLEASLLPR